MDATADVSLLGFDFDLGLDLEVHEVQVGRLIEAVNLHRMQLLYTIAYADKILNYSAYKNLPGFLDGFLDKNLADSIGVAENIPNYTVREMLSDITLSRLDTRPDVLTGLLYDAEHEVSLLKTGFLGSGFSAPDFARIDSNEIISAVSHFAIEVAARSVLQSVEYDQTIIGIDYFSNPKWLALDVSSLGGEFYGMGELQKEVLSIFGWMRGVDNIPDQFEGLFSEANRVALSLTDSASWNTQGDSENVVVIGAGQGTWIETGDGNDVLVGTDGNDALNGWFGDNALLGGGGDDKYYAYVGNENRVGILDQEGQDTLVIDGYITDAKFIPESPSSGRLELEINNGAGIVRAHNHYGVGEIETILHDGGAIWNGIIAEKVDDAWQHFLDESGSVVTGVSEAINNVKSTFENIKDTVIYNFGSDNNNTVTILGKTLDLKNFFNIEGSLIVNIDEDLNGEIDATFTFKGDYAGKDISLSHVRADTILTITTQTAPVAEDDAYTTDENTVIFGNFLADTINGLTDSDPDGDALIVSLINGETLESLDTDPSKSGTQVLLASGAILDIAASGAFTYDPNSAFEHLGVGQSALDTLTYEISDQRRDGVDTAEVTFTVAGLNDKPEAADDSFAGDENAVLTGNLLADNGNGTDSDVDGDELTLQSAVTSTAEGGSVVINTDGSFDYTPFENFSGVDSFDYTLLDGNGGSDTATVTITINGVDDAPVLNPIAGTNASDYLVGTDNADIIHSLGGSYDRSAGGLGADIFVFGSEALNGVRERDVILDYEVGIDAIMLTDGATVGSIRQTSTGAVIFLEGDLDAIYVQGEGVLTGNLTFVPENILFA